MHFLIIKGFLIALGVLSGTCGGWYMGPSVKALVSSTFTDFPLLEKVSAGVDGGKYYLDDKGEAVTVQPPAPHVTSLPKFSKSDTRGKSSSQASGVQWNNRMAISMGTYSLGIGFLMVNSRTPWIS